MGFTPAEVGEMSVWEFSAAMSGYAEAHDPNPGMTASDQDMLWAAVEAKMGRVN